MKIEPTWYANIWIAGSNIAAVEVCRAFCKARPLCVTVTKTDFVYTGGMESGVCVRLVQYPRFPSPIKDREEVAKKLAEALRLGLFQHSYLIEYPDRTEWESDRDEA